MPDRTSPSDGHRPTQRRDPRRSEPARRTTNRGIAKARPQQRSSNSNRARCGAGSKGKTGGGAPAMVAVEHRNGEGRVHCGRTRPAARSSPAITSVQNEKTARCARSVKWSSRSDPSVVLGVARRRDGARLSSRSPTWESTVWPNRHSRWSASSADASGSARSSAGASI